MLKKGSSEARKAGGNVASCFCTPDGRVIHAVGGPVSKSRLLEEARWAVDVHQQMKNQEIKNFEEQASFVQAAHLEEFGVDPDEFENATKDKRAFAWSEYNARAQHYDAAVESGKSPRPVPSVDILASRKAARMLGYPLGRYAAKDHRSMRAHQVFAAQPLVSISDIGARVFESLTGQRYVRNRERVYEVAEGVKRAQGERRPIVFVFYQEDITNPGLNEEARMIMDEIVAKRKKSQKMREAVFVSLPIREQAALTQLVNLPIYNLNPSSSSSTFIVIADPDGQQVVAGSADQIDWAHLSEGFEFVSKMATQQREQLLQ